MDLQELDQKLHQIEDYEKRSISEWRSYLQETGITEEDGEAYQQCIKMWEETHWQWFRQNFYHEKNVVLSYTSARTNTLARSMGDDTEELVLHSRALTAEKEGVRKWMMIQKHPRFGVTFEHSHSFVEINYCYSGSMTNNVSEHPYVMHPGDLMIMEPGCHHTIGFVGENDIMINFVLFPSAMSTIIDKVIPGDSKLSRFLLAALERGFGKNNYVSIRNGSDPRITEILNEIICEYIDEGRTASEAIVGYLVQELFARLWRLSEEEPDLVEYGYQPDNKAVQILHYIRAHAVDCTRESVAEHFGYSGSRISNLLTEQFGKSFVALRNEIRLEMIEEKLNSTDLPVQMIAEEYGFGNQTHFYHIYKEHFGKKPRQKVKDEHFDSKPGGF